VNGVPERFLVDEETVRLSVYIGAQRGVSVAGEAVLIFELVLGWKG
jgi:hypothetical protein